MSKPGAKNQKPVQSEDGPWNDFAATESEDGPWSDFAEPKAVAKPESRKAEAAIEGFGRGVPVLGSYLPQLQAGASMLLGDPNAEIDEKLRKEGFKISAPEKTFTGERDSFARRSEALEEQHPNVFTAGQVAGAVAGSALPAKALPKVPGLGKLVAEPSKRFAGRLAQSTGIAGTVGFLENPGDKEGAISDNLVRRLENAKQAAQYGIFAQLTGEGIAKGAKSIAQGAAKASDGFALKAAGANKGDIRKALTKGRAPSLAKAALDETVELTDEATGKIVKHRLVEAGDTIEDVADKVARHKAVTGEKISALYDDAAKNLEAGFGNLKPEQQALVLQTAFRPKAIAQELSESIGAELKGKAGGQAAMARVSGVLEDLAANGDEVGIKQMHAFRQSVDDLINYDKTLSDMPIAQQKLKAVRDAINKKIEARMDAFGKVVGGDKVAELKRANSVYSSVAELDRMAKGGLAGEQSRAFMGLLDRQGALGGVALGMGSAFASEQPDKALPRAVMFGVGGALASRAARRFGSAGMARTSRVAARTFADTPGMAKEAMYMARSTPGVVGSSASTVGTRKADMIPAPREELAPPVLGDSQPMREVAQAKSERIAPIKMEQNGLKKLGIRDDAMIQDLLKSAKGRDLIRRASDYQPGSPGLKRIHDEIKKGWGQK